MLFNRMRPALSAQLLLLLLMAGAQSGALAHVFEHDAGTPLNQACAICATASQLDASSIDTLVACIIEDCRSSLPRPNAASRESLQVPVARQRGPPTAL